MSMKKRLLQINPVVRTSTSTGRIMQEIGDLAVSSGWESYIAYSKGRDGIRSCGRSIAVPIGNRLSVCLHGVLTRCFDRHGLGSKMATRRFIRQIESIKPDVIHIHNIHGYFLNYKIFFDYLSRSNIPVVWTVHDCWLYTGHCYYYSFAQCDKWKSICGDCPQRKSFPKSWFWDRSRQNFLDKQAAFTSLKPDQLTIVPVSQWIREEMKHSFLKDCNFRVIHNGIDCSVFNPYSAFSFAAPMLSTTEPISSVSLLPSLEMLSSSSLQTGNVYPYNSLLSSQMTDSCECINANDPFVKMRSVIKKKYGIAEGKRIYMAIASIWSREKGWDDYMKLSTMLSSDEQLLMVGVSEEQKAALESLSYKAKENRDVKPVVGENSRHTKPVVGVKRTENVAELAALYALSDVFINFTWQDNYPTVNLESIACGTPVVTYRTGGSVEVVNNLTGIVVEQGAIDDALAAARSLVQRFSYIDNSNKSFESEINKFVQGSSNENPDGCTKINAKGNSIECLGTGLNECGEVFLSPERKKLVEYAQAYFRKEDRYQEYIDLYYSLIRKK